MDSCLRQRLDEFFRDSEQKAYLMARALTRDDQEALELVQDSMLKLVQKYRDRDPGEWAPLFHRILQNRTRDWFRRQKFRQLLRGLSPLAQRRVGGRTTVTLGRRTGRRRRRTAPRVARIVAIAVAPAANIRAARLAGAKHAGNRFRAGDFGKQRQNTLRPRSPAATRNTGKQR